MVFKHKRLRWLLIAALAFFVFVPIFVVVSVVAVPITLLTHVIQEFTPAQTASVQEKCIAWMHTIKWTSTDSEGHSLQHTGLSEAQIQQVTEQGVDLSYGLIQAFQAFGDRKIDKTIQALSPQEISFTQATKRVTVTRMPKATDDSPSAPSEKTSTTTEERVWMLHSIRTYNGLHEFQVEDRSTTVESTSSDGSTVLTTTTLPTLVGDTWSRDYSRLYKEEKTIGLSSQSEDQAFLFRQAILYDPTFGDPLANSVLQEMVGMLDEPLPSAGNPLPSTPLPDASIESALKEAMRLRHVQPSEWEAGMKKLIMAESGGDPHSYNPTPVWYSASWGYQHAAGLCQLMPPTFEAHSMAGHKDIWNPLDNILASIDYIQGKYGTVNNIPGLLHGVYRGY